MERLAQDYLPADLEPLAREAGIGGSVAVQARQTFEETNWLLDLADRNPLIRGVVGWVDLQSDRVEEQLHACAKRPQCVGVRHVVQDEPDPRFVLQEKFVRGLKHLHRFSLTYDLLIIPHQLPAALELVKKLPEQPFVIDHMAKPQIKAGEIDAWQQDIQAIASQPHVLCKLSGIVTQATWCGWKREDFTRYLDVVLEAFGPLEGQELVDAYCGIGTFSLPLAAAGARVLGLESHLASVEQARANAAANGLNRASFEQAEVGASLVERLGAIDGLLLDPPRKGLPALLCAAIGATPPATIAYISCNPATLARDLALLTGEGRLQVERVQPIDFFPQTSHVETLAVLKRI